MPQPTEIKLVLTFFGATGDLAKRKLFPSVFNLYKKGYLQNDFAILGTSRSEMSDDEFRKFVADSLKEFANQSGPQVDDFISHFYYLAHDVTDVDAYEPIKTKIEELDSKYQTQGNRIFYMSVAPRFFGMIGESIKSEGLMSDNGFNRIMIEKPFGTSFQTAEELQKQLESGFDDDQIFRIDHYLGKEMVQNIAPLRFGNPIFNSVWNKDYIKNVQVTLSETLGVEDRAGYYETAGALLDMIQNHTMQVLGWVAMEEPKSFSDKDIREAKNAAFNSLKIYSESEVAENFVRGQYDGYLQEKDVASDSQNNTFIAGKLQFDTNRWTGVPFFIRSGKMLATKTTRVDVVFKAGSFDFGDKKPLSEAVLSIIVDPSGEIQLTLNSKAVTDDFQTRPITLGWQVSDQDKTDTPEPYERMIHDAMNGDGSNFADWNGVAISWKFIDAIAKAYQDNKAPLVTYKPGSMGPEESDNLLTQTKDNWIFKG
jgi:glucose-6-phosphate 1-dehydrogenase